MFRLCACGSRFSAFPGVRYTERYETARLDRVKGHEAQCCVTCGSIFLSFVAFKQRIVWQIIKKEDFLV